MRWGLIPSWATDPAIGARTINARCETAASKPSFREPLQKRRCLIPAGGFYEWQRGAKRKQPFCFEVGDGRNLCVRWPMGPLARPGWEENFRFVCGEAAAAAELDRAA